MLQLRQQLLQTDNKDQMTKIENDIKERMTAMMAVYHTVAIHFADLHDTPEQLLEKGGISDIIPWRESRALLYWRLRRSILEDQMVKEILNAQSNLLVEEAKSMLHRWFLEDKGPTEYHVWWKDNKDVVEWLELQKNPNSTVQTNLHAVRKDAVISQVENILQVNFYFY